MKHYLAFISYRHRDPDQKVSSFLRRKLEGYHLPGQCTLPKKRKLFRDTDELPTSTDLGEDIERALEESEYLIALCSEDYIASRWCMREVELYLNMGRKDRILPVLVSGTPETAIPESIRDIQVAADVRSGKRGDMEAAIPALLSRMTGMDANEFVAQERRFRIGVGTGIAAAVTAAIIGFAAYSMHTAALIEQGNEQVAEAARQAAIAREEAVEQRNKALLKSADYQAEKAYTAIAANDQREAVRLALNALPDDLHGDEPVSPKAVGALRLAMSLPTDRYGLTTSQETQTEITGYRAIYSDLLFMEGIPDPEYLIVLEYGTGKFYRASEDTTVNPLRRAWENAKKKGFTGALLIADNTASESGWAEVYYGAEQPMEILRPFAHGEEAQPVTLHGEPFYADHAVQSTSENIILAWLEEPSPGQERHTALFRAGETEAIAELEITGVPVSAEFAPWLASRYELAVVDEAGVISLYSYKTGELIRRLPGNWSCIHYPDGKANYGDYHRLCAVQPDGRGVRMISTVTGEELMSIDTDSRVLSLSASDERRMLLTMCEDGVYVFSLEDGREICRIPVEETPRFALWGGQREGYRSTDGNMIVLLYAHKVEIYTRTTEIDASVTDVIPLYRPGSTENARIERICYSQDGKRLFIQTGMDAISAWDAHTGAFLWYNDEHTKFTEAVIDISVSEDGRAVWRRNAVDGVERIDAETGKGLYIINGFHYTPVESPDGMTGVAWGGKWENGRQAKLLKGFDLDSGEVLWEEEDYSGQPAFSEDGASLYCVNLREGQRVPSYDLVWRRLEPGSGKITEEKTVVSLTEGKDYEGTPKLTVNRAGLTAAVAFTARDENRQACFRVLLTDLKTGRIIRDEVIQGSDMALHVSADGKYVISREDEADPQSRRCLELDPEKGPGEETDTRTEAGRRMMMTRYQEVRFAGEEGCLNDVQGKPDSEFGVYSPTKLYRLSDHALLLNAEPYRTVDTTSLYNMMIAGSPAGGSVCVYSGETTPVLILDSDPETLAEKARKYLEGFNER